MIDTKNPIPFHLQIRNILADEIIREVYRERIPSERDLMDGFSVSRTTIREAISRLVQDGILEKVHGKGTFISQKPPVHEWLNSLKSLTETVRNMGMEPGSKLLKSGIETVPSFISNKLKESKLFTIKRLRTADSIPFAIERHYYVQEMGMQLAKYDLNSSTIYDLIETELGIELVEADQMISCKIVSREDAVQLGVLEGSNILCVERVILDSNGQPIEYYTGHFRPDMYVFRIKTKRNS